MMKYLIWLGLIVGTSAVVVEIGLRILIREACKAREHDEHALREGRARHMKEQTL